VSAARDIIGDGFRITFPEREMLAYWEGDDGYLFHGGWGVEPPVLAVPSEAAWDEVTPGWLHGRREEVLARLHEIGNQLHEGEDEDWQYRMNPTGRVLRRRE
jgi:hypothetical protein